MVTGLPPAHDMGAAAPDAAPESRGQRAPAWLASLLLHVLVIGLLIGFWRWETREEPPSIEIALVPGNGAAGAEGGSGGGAEAGPAREGDAEPVSAAPATDSTPLPVSVEAQPKPELQPAPPQSAPTDPKPQQTEPTAAAELPSSPPRKPAPPLKAAPPAPPKPQPAQAAAAPTPAPTPGTPGSGAGAGGAEGRGTGVAGAGSAAMGSGDLRAIGDDYLDRLRRHIRRFMAYPQAAKKQKQQGEVVVTVLLRRD
ncbi:MAG TPA: hypothetical protein VEC75_05130, partial [Stellaceae bacterium]|nr:hypothetical protein [Stellaceae bacterium]